MLQVSPVRAFSDNYIWLIRAPADPAAAVVVDPGDDRPVEQALQAQGLRLGAILVTHYHADHVGGVGALAARHGAPVFGPAREQMPCAAQALDDGGKASLEHLGLEFKVMAVPGHTLGHIAYAGHGALFCGDTLFSAGCGRLFEGTPAQMLDSLDRLAALPDATRVFCAHEYTLSNLGSPPPSNPTTATSATRSATCSSAASATKSRCRPPSDASASSTPSCAAANPRYALRPNDTRAHPLPEAVDVFAEVRRWKDGFR